MRKLTAAALLLCLLAITASAQALPMTFHLTSPSSPGQSIDLTADYALLGPGSGMLTLTLLNALTTPRSISGFAFNLPDDGAGVTSVSLASSTNPNFHLVSPSAPYAPNTVLAPYAPYIYDVGLSIGPSFSSAPNLGLGILNGQAATLSLLFSGSGKLFTLNDIQSVMTILGAQTPYHFQVYAPEYDPAPTPIPAAVWLLGSGLAGLVGFKRRRKAA